MAAMVAVVRTVEVSVIYNVQIDGIAKFGGYIQNLCYLCYTELHES